MIGPNTQVVFHDHAPDADCVEACEELQTLPTPQIREYRLPHNHIFQVNPGYPVEDCEACAEIRIDALVHPRFLQYLDYYA